jgi:hypothetical protein
MKILYLGNLTSYVTQNDVDFFESMDHEVIVLNPYLIQKNPKSGLVKCKMAINLYPQRLLKALYGSIGGTCTSILLSTLKYKIGKIRTLIEEEHIDLIYASWGPNMIPLIKAIQVPKIKVPIMYNFMTYPQNVYRWKTYLENLYCKRTIEKIDCRIHATQKMCEYMESHFDLEKHGFDIVMPPFFGRKYFFRTRLPLLSKNDGEPHLVFIGPTSLPWDNICKSIENIAENKIHVHLALSKSIKKSNPYIHFFPYFTLTQLIDGSLSNFMTQFDACIILFNYEVCSNLDRFKTSYPSRFLFALTAGIPVISLENHLTAWTELIRDQEIGLACKNIKELKAVVTDDQLMYKFRLNAIKKRDEFTCERNLSKLNEALKLLIH